MKNKNNDSKFSTNFNTKLKLSFKNPNLEENDLNFNQINQNQNLTYEEQMKMIYEERQKIQNRIKQLDYEENNNLSIKNNNS